MRHRSKSHAEENIAEAQQLIGRAKTAYANNDKVTAESLCRKSLEELRRAHLWEPNRQSHRQQLHRVGRMVHDTFGCRLEFREGSYWVDCPVLLSHNNVGFSIGGSAKVICSICGADNLVCPHIKGRKYNHIVADQVLEYCNICLEKDCCQHKKGEIYDEVEAYGIVVEIELDHVALVKNPANPLCVVNSHSLTESDLLAALPEESREAFVYGKTVVDCHHCRICSGD
jgi:hypothetical protein